MKHFKIHSRFLAMFVIACMLCSLISIASAEQIFYDSFEVVDSNNKPVGWDRVGHPNYISAPLENNTWQTPYGERGMSTYGSGVATAWVDTISNESGPEASGDYLVKFNITSNAAIGEYRAELWATPWGRSPVLLGHAVGDTNGSKDMSFSDQISWRYDAEADEWFDGGWSIIAGAPLHLKLMQDPQRANWRHTPIWDNVSVDWFADVDTKGPELVSIENDNEGGLVVPTNSTVTYTVTFNEPMDASTVNPSDFGNQGTAGVTVSVTPTSDDAVFLVAVTPTDGGTLRLRINENADLRDTAGNKMDTIPLIQDVVTFQVEANTPTLLPADIVDDRDGAPMAENTLAIYTLTFSKDMNASTVSAADFGNAGTAPITIGTITETSPSVFTVEVTPTGSGTLQFRVNPGVDIRAADGGVLNTSEAIADDTILIVDSNPPMLTEFSNDSEGNSAGVGALVTYEVYFNKDMNTSTVDADDFGNAITTGNAPFTINSVEEASPGVFRIEITPTGVGAIQLQVNAGAILEDVIGNALNTSSAIVDETVITVGGTIADPFLAWSAGAAFDADTNGDGIANGLAWFLGASSPSIDARDALPEPFVEGGKLVLAFYCLKPADRGDAVFKVQFSNDLGQTALWTANQAVIPGVSGPVGNIVFNIQEAGDLIYVEAKMDFAGGKMFGRLSGFPPGSL